jgi:AbrB family looped-hinge helix DNA binding protein
MVKSKHSSIKAETSGSKIPPSSQSLVIQSGTGSLCRAGNLTVAPYALEYEYMKIQTEAAGKGALATVKIGKSRQVVIPKVIHDQLGLKPGDILEVKLRKNQVVFTPKELVDRELALAIEAFKAGRFIGPFRTAKAGLRALHRAAVAKPK